MLQTAVTTAIAMMIVAEAVTVTTIAVAEETVTMIAVEDTMIAVEVVTVTMIEAAIKFFQGARMAQWHRAPGQKCADWSVMICLSRIHSSSCTFF